MIFQINNPPYFLSCPGYPAPPPPHPEVAAANAAAAGPPLAGPGPRVVVQYVAAPNFGHRPVQMICPHCQCEVTTSTDSEPGPMAWVLSAILCIVGFGLCACIPCCIDSLNVVTHKCPNCNNFLGRYKGGM